MTLWPKGHPQESSSPEGVTITVLRNKKQLRTGLYGIAKAEKGQGLKKEAKRFTSEMVSEKNLGAKHGWPYLLGGKQAASKS